MTGWKTPAVRQAQDVKRWCVSPGKINIHTGHLRSLKETVKPGESVLDVGCYAGYIKDYLQTDNYIGVDAFESIIGAARELHPGADFRVCDIFDLEKSGIKADVVFCSRVLIHLPYFDRAVKNLIACANRVVIVVLEIGDDICHRVEHGGEIYYVRSFSESTVRRAFGECEIAKRGQYSSVVKWIPASDR